MKNFLLLSLLSLLGLGATSQQYATFNITSANQGTGSSIMSALPGFTWVVEGTLDDPVQILDDEYFEDGTIFEDTFGQADDRENLRIQIYPNGPGTAGQPILSTATLTITFNDLAPADLWGFCLVDMDVENAIISAIDQNDDPVSSIIIDQWLLELVDVYTWDGDIDIPKWDPSHAAILGSDTPDEYTVYNNLVIGGLPSCEAPTACFMPTIPIKALSIRFENLQEYYSTSYHLYIASLNATGITEAEELAFEVYPNPCGNKIQITNSKLQTNSKLKTQNSKLVIIDLHGRLVCEYENTGVREDEIVVDVSHLPAGLYLLKLQTGNGVGVRKFIKK